VRWSLEQGLHADVLETALVGEKHAAVSRLTEFESSPLALVSRLSSACTNAMRCSMLVHATTSIGSDVES
jgi:hypothetical protein